MTSYVHIHQRSADTFSDTTGLVVTGFGTLLYAGVARIYQLGGNTIDLGEGQIAMNTTYCSIPWDSQSPTIDNVLQINTCPEDDNLNGTTWRILNVDGGGLVRVVRRLQITEWDSNRYWEHP
jgi:hypothetical protein